MYTVFLYRCVDFCRQSNLVASYSRSHQLLFELEAVFAEFYRKQATADGEFIADFVVT